MNPQFAAFSALLNAITSAVLGTLVFLRNPRRDINWTYGLFCLSVALWSIAYFIWQVSTDADAALFWSRTLMLPAIFIPIFYTHHLLVLFGPLRLKRPILIISYGFALLSLIAAATPHFVKSVAPKMTFPHWPVPGPLYHAFLPMWFCFVLIGVFLIASRLRHAIGAERNQLRYVLVATLVGWTGGATNFPLWYNIPILPIGNILVSVYIGLTTYAIIRHRLMDINLAITRTAVFLVVYAAILGLPLLAALPYQDPLEQALGRRWWVWLLLSYAALATAAHYVNQHFQRRAEERLLAEQRRYQAILRQASQNMTLIKDLDKLLRRTVALLTKEVGLSHVAIYLWDPRAKKYAPKASRWWRVPSPPTFSPENALLRYFTFAVNPAVTEELQLQARGSNRPVADLQEVVSSLRALRAAVAVPSFVEKRCIGFLVLGEKKSGTLYTPDDLQVFQVLANQSALAVENAIFYEELKRTQADLFQTAKMADLGRMAGGMSHQVNNRFHVLTILSGVLNGLFKGLGTEPWRANPDQLELFLKKLGETLPRLEDNALRGGEIVKTILKFSRPSGEFKLVSLSKVVSTALDAVQYKVDLTKIDLRQEVPEELPAVNGDLNLLAECIFNLVSNANDAIHKKVELLTEGHLPIHVEDPVPYRGWVALRAGTEEAEGKNWVILRVKDNGVGMTEEEVAALFIPFFTTKATAEKGTGLGLYVIQRIIEKHGGTVSATSNYGIGTTFTIKLPAYTEAPRA